MKSVVAIDFACNDPSCGEFVGRAGSACYNRYDAEIEASNFHGYAFSEVDGGIRIHGRVFLIVAISRWVGNWCWNRYWLKREDAKALLRHLRKHRWRMTCAPSRLYAWFNRSEVQ